MTDEPSAPGVTLPSYQPARLWLPSGGTWTVPSLFLPSRMTGAFTPSTGISIPTGVDGGSPGATAEGSTGKGTAVPTVAGISCALAGGRLTLAVIARCTTKPPMASMIRPATMIVLPLIPCGASSQPRYLPYAMRLRHSRSGSAQPSLVPDDGAAARPPGQVRRRRAR